MSRLEEYLSANQLKMKRINFSGDRSGCECNFGRWLAWIADARWGDARRNKLWLNQKRKKALGSKGEVPNEVFPRVEKTWAGCGVPGAIDSAWSIFSIGSDK